MNELFYLFLLAALIPMIYHFTTLSYRKKKVAILILTISFLLFSIMQLSVTLIKLSMILFIIFSTLNFQLVGSFIASVVIFTLLIFSKDIGISRIFYETSIILSLLLGAWFSFYFKRQKIQEEIQRRMLIQSKELSVFHELSVAVQSTFDIDKLLYIYLSTVTAGYGLSFNRAMLFLTTTNKNEIKGRYAIGPLTAIEGFNTYENLINTKKQTLQQLINETEDISKVDPLLNELTTKTTLSIKKHNVIYNSFQTKKPVLVNETYPKDEIMIFLSNRFNLNNYAVVPLISHGEKIGVLIVDNIVNNREILIESLDTLSLISTIMATSIKQSKQFEKTKTWAMKDGLTNLNNQRTFVINIDKSISFAKFNHQSLSICILDIDYFKIYNDTNGHLEGNKLLKELAIILNECVRTTDSVYRFGGEEFVLLMPNTNQTTAKQVAERLRITISNYPFNYREKQPEKKVTVSIGIASLKPEWSNYEQLVEAADIALYKSKQHGRNKVTVYGDHL